MMNAPGSEIRTKNRPANPFGDQAWRHLLISLQPWSVAYRAKHHVPECSSPASDREGTKTRCRAVRYEVRRWKDGTIADAEEAVASPLRVSESMSQARNLLALTESVPSCVWGRDELGLGEMWNSNSVISWLLASAEIPTDEIQPPTGGRAPGWATGILVAEEMLLSDSSGMANNELDVLLRLNIASIEAPHRKDKHHH